LVFSVGSEFELLTGCDYAPLSGYDCDPPPDCDYAPLNGYDCGPSPGCDPPPGCGHDFLSGCGYGSD
jgi:hypothetical protein